MLSSIFNIKEIIVTNINKVSPEEIIKLTELTNEDNIFSISNSKIKEKLKKNAYIADVEIKRSLNGKLTLEITERIPTYMLKFANAYVYINNQGYMIERSEIPIEIPMITGFTTSTENIEVGKRLEIEDLKKLGIVIKITENLKNKEIENLITSIDIADDEDYILTLESQNKKAYFGNGSNINEKTLWLKAIIEKEQGVAGEIFLQNIEEIYFREKV